MAGFCSGRKSMGLVFEGSFGWVGAVEVGFCVRRAETSCSMSFSHGSAAPTVDDFIESPLGLGGCGVFSTIFCRSATLLLGDANGSKRSRDGVCSSSVG